MPVHNFNYHVIIQHKSILRALGHRSLRVAKHPDSENPQHGVSTVRFARIGVTLFSGSQLTSPQEFWVATPSISIWVSLHVDIGWTQETLLFKED